MKSKIPDAAEFEIIDIHTHPFLDFENGCIGPYGRPVDMNEFDYEMKKVGIDRYSGAPLVKQSENSTKRLYGSGINSLIISPEFKCMGLFLRSLSLI